MIAALNSATIVAILLVPSWNFAQEILWDQQPNPDLQAAVDQQFTDFPDFSTYVANDVTFNTSVTISAVATYYTNLNTQWIFVEQAVLNIWNGDPLTDVDDPTTGGDFGSGLVNVDAVDLGNFTIGISVSGLNISLDPGTYWISLTPDADVSTLLQEWRLDSGSTVGSPSFYRNPGGAFGLAAGTSWGPVDPDIVNGYGDAAITIWGTAIPEPTATGLLAVVVMASLIRHRRTAIPSFQIAP